MKNLLNKEFRLATPLLTYFFLGFTLMTFLPGYPILCGAFFVCFGLFQSYQLGREDNDILFTVSLPVKKVDVVLAKYAAAVILQTIAFFFFTVFTIVRMAFLSTTSVYSTNALMGANPVFLAWVLLVFLAFNTVFIGGFFKTAYGYGKPFLLFGIVSFLLIAAAETLHHLPGLGWTNSLDFSGAGRQLPFLLTAAALYLGLTAVSCRMSQIRFGKLDL